MESKTSCLELDTTWNHNTLKKKRRFRWFTNPWEHYTTKTKHNKMISNDYSFLYSYLLKTKCSSITSSNVSQIACVSLHQFVRLWSDVLDILTWFKIIRNRSLPKNGSSSIKMRRSFSSSISFMIYCSWIMSEILRHRHTGVLSDIFETRSDIL